MNIRPLHDLVLIKEITGDNTTESGIVIPGKEEGNSRRGKVLKVGPGKTTTDGTRIPMQLAEGDVVFFSRFGHNEVTFQGQSYYLMPESIVLGVISED